MSQELVKRFGSKYNLGQVIFAEGDSGKEMYIIHKGHVSISKRAKKAEQTLASLGEGDFFGEMALFTDHTRSATATVLEPSIILRIDAKSFEYMVHSNAEFAVNMIRKMSERLKAADDQIMELLSFSPETRLLKALSLYWKKEGTKDKTGEVLLLPYEGFLEFVRKNQGINVENANAYLLKLKNKELVHIRKDFAGKLYISFSPRILDYFNIII